MVIERRTIGRILGKGGRHLAQMKEESGAEEEMADVDWEGLRDIKAAQLRSVLDQLPGVPLGEDHLAHQVHRRHGLHVQIPDGEMVGVRDVVRRGLRESKPHVVPRSCQ